MTKSLVRPQLTNCTFPAAREQSELALARGTRNVTLHAEIVFTVAVEIARIGNEVAEVADAPVNSRKAARGIVQAAEIPEFARSGRLADQRAFECRGVCLAVAVIVASNGRVMAEAAEDHAAKRAVRALQDIEGANVAAVETPDSDVVLMVAVIIFGNKRIGLRIAPRSRLYGARSVKKRVPKHRYRRRSIEQFRMCHLESHPLADRCKTFCRICAQRTISVSAEPVPRTTT